jgi:DNA helicase HerA-like ATPase
MARRSLVDTRPTRVVVIPRKMFLERYWNYEPGQHVTILGKTGSGKTYLGFQLLHATISTDLPGVVLVMKPRDDTVEKWSKRMKLRRVRHWPPPRIRNRIDKPRGWVLWPPLGDFDRDDEVLRREFERCFRESYTQAARRNGEPRALFVDELVGVAKELRLEPALNRLWMRGRSLGVGMWAATQRPFHAPLLAYQAPEHLFIAAEPDARNRQRLGEIGGFDADVIDTIVNPDSGVMSKHQFLYLGREDHVMAIIDR